MRILKYCTFGCGMNYNIALKAKIESQHRLNEIKKAQYIHACYVHSTAFDILYVYSSKSPSERMYNQNIASKTTICRQFMTSFSFCIHQNPLPFISNGWRCVKIMMRNVQNNNKNTSNIRGGRGAPMRAFCWIDINVHIFIYILFYAHCFCACY